MSGRILPPPEVDPATPPGWYPDPWRVAVYRWWDGRAWTGNVAHRHGRPDVPTEQLPTARRPRLGAWVSVPVVVAAVLLAPFVGAAVVEAPIVLALAAVPLLLVVPVLVWIDRLEPEPWSARVHALLWGGTVAVLAASAVNGTVLVSFGESAAAVVSAPLVEETMKGLGILWAVRRREVDGPIDGVVYAGWVAAGFAVVENVEYFLVASDDGVLAETFLARAVFTPFAHPLFTVWTGLAIGWSVARGRRAAVGAWWGWLVAVALHAAWNGAIVVAVGRDDVGVLLVAAVGFVVVFVATAALLVALRSRERRAYVAAMPLIAQRYRVPPEEVGVFQEWADLLAHRRRLPRAQRRAFDDAHAALARLVALHGRSGPTDPVDEQRMMTQLRAARASLRRADTL